MCECSLCECRHMCVMVCMWRSEDSFEVYSCLSTLSETDLCTAMHAKLSWSSDAYYSPLLASCLPGGNTRMTDALLLHSTAEAYQFC